MQEINRISSIDVGFTFNNVVYGRKSNQMVTLWYKHYSDNVLYIRDNTDFQWYISDRHYHIDDRNNQVKCDIPDIEIEFQRLYKNYIIEPDIEHLILSSELGLI